MKISLPQIVASAVAAVIAALVASFFGVTGTVVGVAVGSAVATAGTAVFRHSIERTNEVVRQVVAGSPTAGRLTRPLGRTRTVGNVAHARTGPAGHGPDHPALADPTASAVPGSAAPESAAERAGVTDSTAAGASRLISTHIDDGQRWDGAPTRPARTVQRRVHRMAGGRRPIPWPRYVGVAAVVAVLALGLVTGVELVAGEPLSSLLGVHGSPGSGSSVSHLFGSSGPTTTTTTTSTPSSSSTTSTTAASATTTTGASGSTSTIAPGTGTGGGGGTGNGGTSTSTTSTTRPVGSTTTTTSPSR